MPFAKGYRNGKKSAARNSKSSEDSDDEEEYENEESSDDGTFSVRNERMGIGALEDN